MKKKLLTIISTISLMLMLVLTPILSTSINTSSVSENLDTKTRTVSASSSQIDLENAFSEFEEGTLTITEETVSVEGIKTFKLSDFSEFDLVADSDVDEEVARIKYNVDYNNQTNEITLSITLANETQNIDDKLVGYAFVNEAGNIDAIFDCDGETIYLSELQELGMIENCGFFSRLFNSVKKAVSTTAGKIITAAAAVTCVAVGVVGAIVAAPVVAVVAVGAVVGAVGLGAAAAVSTSITDGAVDWEAVGYCVGVGAVVGGAISGISYGVTKLIKDLKNKRIYQVAYAVGTSPLVITSAKLNYIEALSVLAAYKISSSTLEGYGMVLIPEKLFTKTMKTVLKILRDANVSKSYLGAYTPLQSDAAALAFALGGVEYSAFDHAHGTGGYYQHYHDKNHTIHVWFGSPF